MRKKKIPMNILYFHTVMDVDMLMSCMNHKIHPSLRVKPSLIENIVPSVIYKYTTYHDTYNYFNWIFGLWKNNASQSHTEKCTLKENCRCRK